MIKKTVRYEDFNGEMTSEDLYFHLNKKELMDLEMSGDESFSAKLLQISESKDIREILSAFQTILLSAYGIRSEDGKKFRKSKDIRDEFENSEAFSELLFGMLSEPDDAAKFMGALMPKDLLDQAMKNAKLNPKDSKQLQEAISSVHRESNADVAVENQSDNEGSDGGSLDDLSREELIKRLSAK